MPQPDSRPGSGLRAPTTAAEPPAHPGTPATPPQARSGDPGRVGGPLPEISDTASADRIREWLAERIPSVTTFVLRRLEDTTGVSGTGVVADGAVFPDMRTVTRRRTKGAGVAQTCVWDNLHHVRRIHGHDGKTRIELVPYGVLVDMVNAALDVAADLEAVGEDGATVVDAMVEVLDRHVAHEAELDAAARGPAASSAGAARETTPGGEEADHG